VRVVLIQEGGAVFKVGVALGSVPGERVGLHRGYIEGLVAVDAVPVLFPGTLGRLKDYREVAKELVGEVDSLMVTGGGDVDPGLYGAAELHPSVYGVEKDRDVFEVALVREAMAQGKRVLGICRGIQVINVAYGGTIIQDLAEQGFDDHRRGDVEYSVAHSVTLADGSVLAKMFGQECGVNSLHHQAVDKVGDGLVVTARSDDGVIEGLEADNLVAVQWHPERMLQGYPEQLALFNWVVGPMSA